MNVSPSKIADTATARSVAASAAAGSTADTIDRVGDTVGELASEAARAASTTVASIIDAVGAGASDVLAAGNSALGRSSRPAAAAAPMWLFGQVWRRRRLVGTIGFLAILGYVGYRYWRRPDEPSPALEAVPTIEDRQPA